MIKITPVAKSKFLEVVAAEKREGHGLRVIVQGGGTPRPEFALNFVAPDQVHDDDVVHDAGGLKVYMDPNSAPFLEGATVDFVNSLAESGFKVDAPNAGVPKPAGPLAEAVQKALDDKINPAVASHGGFVELVAVDDGTAYLRFGGGCQGCGMINVTLKQGVEKIIFAEVPTIQRVLDVTDHASGSNPYYQPAK
jgi:Fe/S biogenesis protein NfuA